MKDRKKKALRPRWLWILIVQAASMLLLSLALETSYFLGSWAHNLCAWVVFPVAGLFSACFATRRGLLNYAAWIVPPAMQFLGYYIRWTYFINPGPVFLCAFISLIGAAAGEVLKRRDKK